MAAVAALKAGKGAAARDLLLPLAEAHPTDAQLWMMLGEACRLAGDHGGMDTAADRLIALEPRAVRAYGWKGDVAIARGDRRTGASWYKRALATAAAFDPVPASLTGDVTRISGIVATLDAAFAGELEAALAAAGHGEGAGSARFRQSVAIMTGAKQLHLQQPTTYYFPELPQRQFYERTEFAWAAAVEAATDAIRAELFAALAADSLFQPYLVNDPDRPRREFHGLTDNPDWSGLHIIENGAPSAANMARFPATLAAMALAPLCRIGVRAPTVMFSRLAPGARIPPHHGMINARLICHLPLVVPGDGALRVGNEARGWEPGKLLIFDDSIEHEAWNNAAGERIVLIFDIWRPELSTAEQAGVTALFAAVDTA